MGIGIKRVIFGSLLMAGNGLIFLAHQENPAELEEASQAVVVADHEMDVLRQDIGEGCASILDKYFSDPDLQGTSTEQVLSDLRNDPTTPCGESPTDVRKDYNGYFAAHRDLGEAQAQLDDIKHNASLKAKYEEGLTPKAVTGALGITIAAGAVRLGRQKRHDPDFKRAFRARMTWQTPRADELKPPFPRKPKTRNTAPVRSKADNSIPFH